MPSATIISGDITTNTAQGTCPEHSEATVLSVFVEYRSSVVVGTRQLCAEMLDVYGNVAGRVLVGVQQAGNLTYHYELSPSCADLTAVRNGNFIMTPLPLWTLSWGQMLRIRDIANIDAAGDQMRVHVSGLVGP